MSSLTLELILILLLVLLNGIFSMAEMAIVSSRKARLRQQAEQGRRSSAVALQLAENPHDFLSTVQIGITLVGTLAGAFGGATLAGQFAAYLSTIPAVAPYDETIAIIAVVLAISYLSLVIGELVPKNLALSSPERIASVLAPPMRWLSRLGLPAVVLLTTSTKLVMKLIPFKAQEEVAVTEEDVRMLLAQGTELGTFEAAEQEMVERVFRLADRSATDLMKPRGRVLTVDLGSSWEANRGILLSSEHSRYPMIDARRDRILGVLYVKDLFTAFEQQQQPDLLQLLRQPLLIPENTPALELLHRLQHSGDSMALIVDEHSSMQGIVTLTDLMNAIAGDLTGEPDSNAPRIVQREDGSWLADGALPVPDLLEALRLKATPGGAKGFHTVGGLFLAHAHRIPGPGDRVDVDEWCFEVVDMDGNRIDKLLVTRRPPSPAGD